jgi:hypothetical protein
VSGELGEAVPYKVNAWVKLDGAGSDDAKVSLKITDDDGTRYENLASGKATDSDWTELSGTFTIDLSGTPSDLVLYIEGPAAGVDLLVDDVSVRPDCDTPAKVVQAL